jgi:hypothetical protein
MTACLFLSFVLQVSLFCMFSMIVFLDWDLNDLKLAKNKDVHKTMEINFQLLAEALDISMETLVHEQPEAAKGKRGSTPKLQQTI